MSSWTLIRTGLFLFILIGSASADSTTSTTLPTSVTLEGQALDGAIGWLAAEAWHSQQPVFGTIIYVKNWMWLLALVVFIWLSRMNKGGERPRWRR